MKKYNLANIIGGWAVFAIAAIVYLMTMEPTASFWDCGEFISTAHKQEVGHPPGAPFFMLLGKLFTVFAGNNHANVAKMVNALSALASAATIMFLFWTITHLAKKLFTKDGEFPVKHTAAVIGAGLIGSLAYTFSDTFWFSAVEGEVYATSSFFTAVVFWAILKWENVANEPHSNRWLILIAYLMGISVGVHLLNLLAIPAIVFVFYTKKYKITKPGIVVASIVSIAILAMVNFGVIPGIVEYAAKFELLFVNTFGLPFNSGMIFFIILLLGLLGYGLYLTQTQHQNHILITTIASLGILFMGATFPSKGIILSIFVAAIVWVLIYVFLKNQHAIINTILLGLTVILIGYSSYAVIYLRATAETPMNINNPQDPYRLLRYLNREQYGDSPLFYGQYFNAVPTGVERSTTYRKTDDKYIKVNNPSGVKYTYDDKFQTFFPRMHANTKPQHVPDYKEWGKINEKRGKKVTIQTANGPKTYSVPRFKENITFFWRYQIRFMYMRYFMWNFAGRQNDIQGHGEPHHGNWISGIKAIDEWRLGDLDKLPENLKSNPANNKYYFLPLIFGIMGMIFQYRKSKTDFSIVALLFFLTGLAIVLYLNQDPHQPRERDYAYAGSFYAFAIWIGLGILWIYELISAKKASPVNAILLTVVGLLLVPSIMAKENWDDHDRSNRYTARDFAINYLESCAPNAIIFTYGDNDTYPLWYAQEVEEIRTDIRVINLSFLAADWYIEQMYKKAYESDVIPFSLKTSEYYDDANNVVSIIPWTGAVDLDAAFIYAKDKDYRKNYFSKNQKAQQMLLKVLNNNPNFTLENAISTNHFPSNTFRVKADSGLIVEKETVSPKYHNDIEDVIFTYRKNDVYKNDLMVLDLLAHNNWERPVYFAISVPTSNYGSLQPYLQQHGMAHRVVPYKGTDNLGYAGSIDTDIMYDNMMNKFKWGGLETDNKLYLDENNRRMISNFKNNFVILSSALTAEGKNDSAKMVLDKAMDLFNDRMLDHNYTDVQFAQQYYQIGDSITARNIVTDLFEKEQSKMEYYLSFPKEKSKWLNDDVRYAFITIRNIAAISNQVGEKEILDQVVEYLTLIQPELELKFPNAISN